MDTNYKVNRDYEEERFYELDTPPIKNLLRNLANNLKARMPKGWGFTLFIFSHGQGKQLFYISSAQRLDMVNAVKEWLAKQESA